MRKLIKRLPEGSLMPFLVFDNQPGGVLRIRFDDLCEFLIKIHGRSFSPSTFEKKLQSEIDKKLKGKPLTKGNLKALCKYIDELSIYLSQTKEKVETGDLPAETQKEFFERNKDKYVQLLERAKRNNPEEYERLSKRFEERFSN
jgi:hypothetical protein